VLHDVRHVGPRAIQAGGRECVIEHAAGGPDEWAPLDVLPISGLLADQDDLRGLGSLTEHRLRAALPEIVGPAIGGGLRELVEAGGNRDMSSGRRERLASARRLPGRQGRRVLGGWRGGRAPGFAGAGASRSVGSPRHDWKMGIVASVSPWETDLVMRRRW
jgi:hypothetical protein